MRHSELRSIDPAHVRVDGLKRMSGRDAFPCGVTRYTIMSLIRQPSGSRTEECPGADAHTIVLDPALAALPGPYSPLDEDQPHR
jgi:hypothetical protein